MYNNSELKDTSTNCRDQKMYSDGTVERSFFTILNSFSKRKKLPTLNYHQILTTLL